jgi:hypothetical protein
MGAQYDWDGRDSPIEQRARQTVAWMQPVDRTKKKGLT